MSAETVRHSSTTLFSIYFLISSHLISSHPESSCTISYHYHISSHFLITTIPIWYAWVQYSFHPFRRNPLCCISPCWVDTSMQLAVAGQLVYSCSESGTWSNILLLLPKIVATVIRNLRNNDRYILPIDTLLWHWHYISTLREKNRVGRIRKIKFTESWWSHQIDTFSVLLALCAGNSPVTGEFPSQRPMARSFDIFFNLRLEKQLSKQSWGWWFETS